MSNWRWLKYVIQIKQKLDSLLGLFFKILTKVMISFFYTNRKRLINLNLCILCLDFEKARIMRDRGLTSEMSEWFATDHWKNWKYLDKKRKFPHEHCYLFSLKLRHILFVCSFLNSMISESDLGFVLCCFLYLPQENVYKINVRVLRMELMVIPVKDLVIQCEFLLNVICDFIRKIGYENHKSAFFAVPCVIWNTFSLEMTELVVLDLCLNVCVRLNSRNKGTIILTNIRFYSPPLYALFFSNLWNFFSFCYI